MFRKNGPKSTAVTSSGSNSKPSAAPSNTSSSGQVPSNVKAGEREKKISDTSSRNVTGVTLPNPCKVASSRVIIVYSDSQEFDFERKLLWNEVLPELQNFAFNNGFDIEWFDPFPDSGALTNIMAEQIIEILRRGEADWIMFLLGDRYGSIAPPVEMRRAEFDCIRKAAFEINVDVKILDQCYALDRTREHEEYRLVADVSEQKTKAKLLKTVQKGAAEAFKEGTINQVHEDRQKRFFQSPIHLLLEQALELKSKSIFLLRKFEGKNLSKIFVEQTEDAQKSIENLKNKVSTQCSSKDVFSHRLMVENGDIEQFFSTKEGDKYGSHFCKQVLERLKSQLLECHANVISPPVKTATQISDEEHGIHECFLRERLKQPWLSRAFHDKLVDQLLSVKEECVVNIQAPELSGKTRFLCRLYEKVPSDSYKLIRFINLTHSSNFAHEMWHHLCTAICKLSNQSATELTKIFKLNDTMAFFEKIMLNLTKPLYLFLDDIHLLKFGYFLGQLDAKLRKGPQKLYLYTTCQSGIPMNCPFIITQTVSMDSPTNENIVDMLKLQLSTTTRKVTSDQLSCINIQLTGANQNVLVANVLLDELLDGGTTLTGGIEGRLSRLENRYGQAPVRSVGRYLSASYHGLSRLELFDVLSSNMDANGPAGSSTYFPPLLLDNILNGFGSLLAKVTLHNRVVYQLSSMIALNTCRHRYYDTTQDLKTTHNEIVDLFGELVLERDLATPRFSLMYQVFPQPLKRESGSVNRQKIENLWYHLLHTGNMDALKDWTLCQFEYVDAVVSSCGILHLLALYEECAMQVLHHDIQVLCEQVLLPALPTVVRDSEQLAAEVIGRLRFTRGENSHFLNSMVEQAMGWVDTYNRQPLLVPLTCWISPPVLKSCRSFTLKDWKADQTIVTPTHNHQHVLISGNQSTPGAIFMYHIPSQLLVNTFAGHTGAVTSLNSSSCGTFFISTSTDKSIKMWSFISGECTATWTPHKGKIMCGLMSSDDKLLVTGSADSSAKVIRVETGEVIKSFSEHTGSVVSLQLTSNDQFLITGSGDFVVQMFNINTGACICRMGGLMAPVSCLAITSNDAFVAVGCEDETLRVYSTVSGQELHELMGHEGKVNALIAAQDDCQLFAGTKSKIYCYDIHNGQIIDILDCQQPNAVGSLKITSDNYFLVSGCGPRIHVWNINKRQLEQHDLQMDKEGFVTAIAMSPDQKIAACGTYNGIVALWDLDICQCINTIIQSKGVPVTCTAFGLNSSYLLSGNSIGNIIVIDSTNGSILKDVNPHSSEIVSICSLENGKVYSCCKDGRLAIWHTHDIEENEEESINGILGPIFAPPSGKLIISHCPNSPKEMKIWALTEQGFVQKNKIHHNEEITCFGAAAQGTLVATGSSDHSVKLWQIESGYLTQILVGHDNSVTCIAMDEEEHIVVSGAKDHKVIIWNVATGQIVHTLQTKASVTTVGLTADSTVTFCGMEDGWIEAWSTEKGQLISSFNAHRPIRHMLQSFDANRLLVHLTGCAQLPILCLHNSPAGRLEVKQRRKSARTQSITSLGNQNEPKKEITATLTTSNLSAGNGNTTARPSAPRSTFDKLERSKSRSSVIEKDRTTTLTNSVPVTTQKSSSCTLL